MYITYLKIFLSQFEFGQTVARKFMHKFMRTINCRSKYRKYFIQTSLKYRCRKENNSLGIVTSEINIPIYNE